MVTIFDLKFSMIEFTMVSLSCLKWKLPDINERTAITKSSSSVEVPLNIPEHDQIQNRNEHRKKFSNIHWDSCEVEIGSAY